MKLKKKCGAVDTIIKNGHNTKTIKATLLKIYMQIVSNPLKNFT